MLVSRSCVWKGEGEGGVGLGALNTDFFFLGKGLGRREGGGIGSESSCVWRRGGERGIGLGTWTLEIFLRKGGEGGGGV